MVSNTEQLESVSAGEDIKTALEKLDSGKATTVKVGEGESAMLYLVYKGDIAETAKTYFESTSNRSGVLSAMKSEDFEKYIKELAENLEYEKSGAVDGYDPKMFFVAEQPTTAAPTTAAEDEATEEEATTSAE